MQPEKVNPGNFIVEKIIYNEDNFSIAKGLWGEDNEKRFAMRWNGRDNEKGYPSVFDNPMWFQLPNDVRGVLAAIIGHSDPLI